MYSPLVVVRKLGFSRVGTAPLVCTGTRGTPHEPPTSLSRRDVASRQLRALHPSPTPRPPSSSFLLLSLLLLPLLSSAHSLPMVYEGPLVRRPRNETSRSHRHDALNAMDQLLLRRLRRRFRKITSDSNLLLALCIIFLSRGHSRLSIASLILVLVSFEDRRVVERYIRRLLITHTMNRPIAMLHAPLAWRLKHPAWLDNHTGFENFDDLYRFFVLLGLGPHDNFIGGQRH